MSRAKTLDECQQAFPTETSKFIAGIGIRVASDDRFTEFYNQLVDHSGTHKFAYDAARLVVEVCIREGRRRPPKLE